MADEVRVILFSSDETLHAISLLNVTASRRLFVGKAISCNLRSKPKVIAIVEIENGDAIESLEINSTQLAAAMIGYCRRAHIPLPRKATKELDVLNNQLVVILTLGEPDEGVLKALAAAK